MLADARHHLRAALLVWRHHRMLGFLSVLGVVAGIAGLVAALAIGEGARQDINAAIGQLGAGSLVVRSVQPDAGISQQRLDALQRLLGETLDKTVPRLSNSVSVTSGSGHMDGIAVIGTAHDYFTVHGLQAEVGRPLTWFDNEHHRRVIVLGREVARSLFPRSNPVGERVRINDHWYQVVGTLTRQTATRSTSLPLPDFNRTVFAPLGTVATDFDQGDIDELLLNFNDESDTARLVPAVTRILEFGAAESGLEYLVPSELIRQKFRMQTTVRYLLVGMTLVMLLVGGIGIMNMMLVNVIRRRPEIGLRRALGASQRDILSQFIVESVLITASGGLVGIAVGATAAWLVALRLGWPVGFVAQFAALGILVSVSVGVLFGSYPARQAAQVAPIKTLNHG